MPRGARTSKKQPINESDAARNSFCSQTHMQTDAETPGGETEPSAASLLREKHAGKEYICFLMRDERWKQGTNRETEVCTTIVEENDSLKPFFITAHPSSHDSRTRNEIGNSVLQLLSYTHLYYYIPHTHTPLSRSLPHTKFRWGKVWMKLWASSWVPALISVLRCSDFIFLLLLESTQLRAATAHRRTCSQTHSLALLLRFKWDSAVCCYLFEIKRATSASLVITLKHTDSSDDALSERCCINLESFCKQN